MRPRPVMIMAGGTGGHVFPGLAVALDLRERGVPVTWLGTRRGLEARVVPARGIPLEFVSIGGLRGKGMLTRLLAPFRLLWAMLQSVAVMLRHRPRAVLGMGGFVSGPGGVAAWLTRRPLLIHEQNAVAGLTNRLLARLATEVLEAFPGGFPAGVAARPVGNPVRPEIAALPPPRVRMGDRAGPVRLLVFGGSQGALRLNRVVPAAVARLPRELRPYVRHQAGERTLGIAEDGWREAGMELRVETFIEDMAAAYAWADLAICRAGALTVSELAAAGLGAILVPFAAAVDDHQTRNAGFLVDAGAARLVPEAALSPERLAAELETLLADREALIRMAEQARALARPDALEEIVACCLDPGAGGRA